MEYRYFVDFQLGISVFATFSYGIVVLGIPQCVPLETFSNSVEVAMDRTPVMT